MQVYFQEKYTKQPVETPVKRLVRFAKVEVEAGHVERLSFSIPVDELGYYLNTKWGLMGGYIHSGWDRVRVVRIWRVWRQIFRLSFAFHLNYTAGLKHMFIALLQFVNLIEWSCHPLHIYHCLIRKSTDIQINTMPTSIASFTPSLLCSIGQLKLSSLINAMHSTRNTPLLLFRIPHSNNYFVSQDVSTQHPLHHGR